MSLTAERPAAPAAPAPLAKLPGSWELSFRAFRCWLVMYRRTWRSSIWSSVFGPLFYLGAMGYGLGSLVDQHGTSSLGNVPYVVFVGPAVLAVHSMNTGLSNSMFPVFGAVHWNRIYVAARASMLRPADIYRGHLLFMTMRIAMNAALVTVYIWALGAARSAWVILAWPAATLTGLAFAAPIAAWAVSVKSENNFAYMFRFGMMPLMLFSGTFFPLSQLPAGLRLLAYATPLWHGVDLCRMLSLGRIDLPLALINVAYLAVLAAFGVWAGARSYRRRLYV
jgi:lipooligosaccharide transport system permease protein